MWGCYPIYDNQSGISEQNNLLFYFIYLFIYLLKIIIITIIHITTHQYNPEQEVSESFLGLSRRPPLLPDNTSLAVNDLQIFYIDLQIRK